MKINNLEVEDKLLLFRNYQFALQERQEYGTMYGDTDEIIEMYEKRLNINRKGQGNVSSGNIKR